MVVEAITSTIFEKLLDRLPGWLGCLFVSPKKIASKVEIDLRRDNPIEINLGTEIPRLDIRFRITNLSSVNLVLDRLLINLWVGQPTLNEAILVRYDVPRKDSREDIYFTYQLSVPQQEQIRKKVKGERLSVPITIHVKAYFDSKVGFVCVKKRLEHRDVLCRG
jgi:hypothetical protein